MGPLNKDVVTDTERTVGTYARDLQMIAFWTFARHGKDVCPSRHFPVSRLPVTEKMFARRDFPVPE